MSIGRDILEAHSYLGAEGWELVRGLPEWAPKNAVGTYKKRGKTAVLVAAKKGCVLRVKG